MVVLSKSAQAAQNDVGGCMVSIIILIPDTLDTIKIATTALQTPHQLCLGFTPFTGKSTEPKQLRPDPTSCGSHTIGTVSCSL